MLSILQLRNIYIYADKKLIEKFIKPLNATMEHYAINTKLRQAAFLAQVGHESGELRYVEEIASGVAYEGREDLGNTSPGDGVKYKGRGLIQITGKTNYLLCGMDLDLPLLEQPELLSLTDNAAMSAGWFWDNNNLNTLADAGEFEKLTRRVNGGVNGLKDRQRLYKLALKHI